MSLSSPLTVLIIEGALSKQGFHPCPYKEQSTANSNLFKITVQKTASEAKGRLDSTGKKVIQRLFIIDLYT